MIRYIMASRSCSFVSTLHSLIITIMQTYMNALNFYNTCHVYAVKYVSMIKSNISIIFISYMGLCVFS